MFMITLILSIFKMRWYSLGVGVIVDKLILKHQFGFSSSLSLATFLRHFDVFIRNLPSIREELLRTHGFILI